VTPCLAQVGRYISIPKSYATFVPGSIVAGMVRGMLSAAGFPARREGVRACVVAFACACMCVGDHVGGRAHVRICFGKKEDGAARGGASRARRAGRKGADGAARDPARAL
jgi:hypothetical protein